MGGEDPAGRRRGGDPARFPGQIPWESVAWLNARPNHATGFPIPDGSGAVLDAGTVADAVQVPASWKTPKCGSNSAWRTWNVEPTCAHSTRWKPGSRTSTWIV